MIRLLKSKIQIKRIFDKGLVLKKDGLLLKYIELDQKVVFFGISVPKKNFKSAVDRNLIKRRLKEIVRKSLKSNSLNNGVSFFLIYNFKTIKDSRKLSVLFENLRNSL
jgi:ribonuclease P protein component